MQFSCRHRAGADPGNLGDGVRRTERGSLPGSATDHAQLQHAGQHAQAVGDDGRRHPLPRLSARIGQRRIAAAQCAAACHPLPLKRAREAGQTRGQRQAGDRARGDARAGRTGACPQGSAGAGAGRQGRAGCCPCPRARHPSRRRSNARAHHSPRRRACSRCCNCARARDTPGRRCCRAERRERGRYRQPASRDRHQQAVRPRDRAQARARCNRRALPEEPQLPAAVGVAGRAQRARPGRVELSAHDRRRRPRSEGLPRCRGSTSAARRRRPKPS